MLNSIKKPIQGYEGIYWIDNLGNIYNSRKQLKTYFTKTNYECIKLVKDGIRHNHSIHRLVAETFIPNPYNKSEVNHIDGNKSNNHYSNLEWVTAKENTEHSLYILKNKTNKGCTWENHNFSSIQCYEMINLYNKKYSFRKIAKLFKSNHKTISKIIKNEKYNN